MSLSAIRMVFIGLTEMEKYCGPEDNLSGGGSYIDQEGFGHELFNFKLDGNCCYGYTPPWGKLNLQRISSSINTDSLGTYVDDVLVVFTGSRTGIGRLVVGWYEGARIYSECVNDKRQARYLENIHDYVGYNIVSSSENVTLIDSVDRNYVIPPSRTNKGIGHGHHNVWYADQQNAKSFRDQVLKYILTYKEYQSHNSEIKYHLHNESRPYVSTSTQITRSQQARHECIEIYGCYCNICGFDFEKTYGALGKDYIEVHHITPIGQLSSAEGYEGTDPKKDLIPLCSNCHSMVHRKKTPFSPTEIRRLIKQNSDKV